MLKWRTALAGPRWPGPRGALARPGDAVQEPAADTIYRAAPLLRASPSGGARGEAEQVPSQNDRALLSFLPCREEEGEGEEEEEKEEGRSVRAAPCAFRCSVQRNHARASRNLGTLAEGHSAHPPRASASL
ncbi:unnamed protein product, partial [Prorocentrum cordatum]